LGAKSGLSHWIKMNNSSDAMAIKGEKQKCKKAQFSLRLNTLSLNREFAKLVS
jgi:hypothetical protein